MPLVREAALLALARLKFAPAVPQIMYMYRTDIIRDVRQAATVALVGIGGAEAERVDDPTACENVCLFVC